MAPSDETADDTIYKVVVNHEEQYSIWPAVRDSPSGWRDAGTTGNKTECLGYISDVWTDMRPRSLRKHLEEIGGAPAEEKWDEEPTSRSLMERLSAGRHPVELTIRPERSARAAKERIDRGYIHVKFTDTRGGSDLGVRLDARRTDVSQADFERGVGTLHLEGDLVLDDESAHCVADIDIGTMAGTGHLEPSLGS